MHSRTLLLLLGVIIVSSGCFTYVNADPGRVVPGRDVRVELTDAGTAGLAALVGPSTRAIDGRVTHFDTAALQLAVTQTTDQRNFERLWRGEPVTVPHAFIARLEQRKFSLTRTALLAGGIVAATVVGGVAAHNAGGTPSGGGHHGGS